MGGALFIEIAFNRFNVVIQECIFLHNRASFTSGVVEVRTSEQLIELTLRLEKCTITDAFASQGAAVMHVGTGLTCADQYTPFILFSETAWNIGFRAEQQVILNNVVIFDNVVNREFRKTSIDNFNILDCNVFLTDISITQQRMKSIIRLERGSFLWNGSASNIT
jgi:hypothetical protein